MAGYAGPVPLLVRSPQRCPRGNVMLPPRHGAEWKGTPVHPCCHGARRSRCIRGSTYIALL